MRFRWIVTISLFLTGLLLADAPSGDTVARLVVQVSNGTKNGATVTGDTVTVWVFRQKELVKSLSAMVDERGRAVFEGLPARDDSTAVARVSHQSMTFQGRPVVLASTGSDYVVRIEAFDVSSDATGLSVWTHQITIGVRSGSVEFKEYMILRNSSDKAIRGLERDAAGKPIVVMVSLPKGYKDLALSGYFDQSVLVTTETGFYDTLAVPPGEHEATFSYRIGVDSDTVDVVKELSLPTSELEVFWEGGQGRLQGLGQPDSQLTNAKGVLIEYYRPDVHKAGDQISFRITGLPATTSDAETWTMLAVVFGVMVMIAAWRLVRRPTSEPSTG